MNRLLIVVGAAAGLAVLTAAAEPAHARVPAPTASAPAASNPIVYPARGQSEKEQSKDRFECYEWSRAQSGYDPTRAAETPPPPMASASQSSGAPVTGMVGGAIGGAAIAEVTHHDAGRGAAIGALGGGMRERMRDRQAQAQQQQVRQQQAAQQQAARSQQRSTYDRAFGACMEARGYTVK